MVVVITTEAFETQLVELLGGKEPLCFLTGAGISMDAPASLASARQLMEAIIAFGAPEQFVTRLLELPGLRYELLVQQFKTIIDKNLVFLRYFDEHSLAPDREPNIVHRYLSRMLLAGHPVMTTNFDHFIERAVGLREPRLRAVITPVDFDRYGDPGKNSKEGLAVLYKLHGSPRNAITGEDTSKTAITTIDALGKDKEGDFFAVEVFKRPLFDHVCNGRVLVVMGYSGGDDFDVVPMLNRLEGARAVVWLNHVTSLPDEVQRARGFIISRMDPSAASKGKSTLDDTLAALARRLATDVFKVDAMTSDLIARVEGMEPILLAGKVALKGYDKAAVVDWLAHHIHTPPLETRAAFASAVFQATGFPEDAMQASEVAFDACKQKGDTRGIAMAMASIATQGYLTRKLPIDGVVQKLHDARDMLASIGDDRAAAGQVVAVGMIYAAIGENDKALDYLKSGKEAFEVHGFDHGVGNALLAMGNVHHALGDLTLALNDYAAALKIHEKIGDLYQISHTLTTIARSLARAGNLDGAAQRYQQALAIQERLQDRPSMAATLSDMAGLQAMQHERDKAMKNLARAKELYRGLGDLAGVARSCSSQGDVAAVEGRLDEARELHVAARAAFEKLGDATMVVLQDASIARVDAIAGRVDVAHEEFTRTVDALERAGNLQDAAMVCHDAWKSLAHLGGKAIDDAIEFSDRMVGLYEKLGDSAGVAEGLARTGEALVMKHELGAGIARVKEAWKMASVSQNVETQMYVLRLLGQTFMERVEYFKGGSCFQKALDRAESTGRHRDALDCLISLARAYIMSGRHDDAGQHLARASALATRLNQHDVLGQITKMKQAIEEIPSQSDRIIAILIKEHETAAMENNKGNLAKTLAMIACHYRTRQSRDAIPYMQRAVDASRAAGDPEELALLIDELANTYLSFGDHVAAARYYQEAITTYEQVGDNESAAVSRGNMGVAHFQRGSIQDAVECWETTLKDMKALKKVRDTIATMGNLAAVYSRQGDLARTVSLYEDAISVLGPLQDDAEAARAHLNLGAALLRANNKARGKQALEKGLTLATSAKDDGLQRAISKQLASLG